MEGEREVVDLSKWWKEREVVDLSKWWKERNEPEQVVEREE